MWLLELIIKVNPAWFFKKNIPNYVQRAQHAFSGQLTNHQIYETENFFEKYQLKFLYT